MSAATRATRQERPAARTLDRSEFHQMSQVREITITWRGELKDDRLTCQAAVGHRPSDVPGVAATGRAIAP